MKKTEVRISHISTAAAILAIILLAIYASVYLSQQSALVSLVESWGYISVVVVGLVSGLNAIVPIPAATLTPVFTAAGLTTTGIIFALVLGTMLADSIGFLFGRSTKQVVQATYPKLIAFIHNLTTTRQAWVLPFVVFYAAFIPLPNEILLIPLAYGGISFIRIIIPLIIGNTINQLISVYGVMGLVNMFG